MFLGGVGSKKHIYQSVSNILIDNDIILNIFQDLKMLKFFIDDLNLVLLL